MIIPPLAEEVRISRSPSLVQKVTFTRVMLSFGAPAATVTTLLLPTYGRLLVGSPVPGRQRTLPLDKDRLTPPTPVTPLGEPISRPQSRGREDTQETDNCLALGSTVFAILRRKLPCMLPPT